MPPAEPSITVAAVPLTPEQMQSLQKDIVAALCTCFDPEIPVNIYELGLIYNVEMSADGSIGIRMTLTSPGCPVAGSLPGDVHASSRRFPACPASRWMSCGSRPGTRAECPKPRGCNWASRIDGFAARGANCKGAAHEESGLAARNLFLRAWLFRNLVRVQDFRNALPERLAHPPLVRYG